MNILGLSFDYHDAAAALICDGKVVAAAQEERFSRRKNDAGIPAHASRFCLEQAGLSAQELDQVVFYERSLLKFDRIVTATQSEGARGRRYLEDTLRAWVGGGKFDVPARIERLLGVPETRISTVEHHQSHAAAAFFSSGFDEATVVTLDGVGEYETATVSVGRGTTLDKRDSVRIPHSLGLFYSAFTAFLGFEVNEGEYKVMGMAGFGRPAYEDLVRSLISLEPDGTFRISGSHFDFNCPEALPYTQAFLDVMGEPRVPESPFRLGQDGATPGSAEMQSRHYANVAASLQRVVEDAILHVVATAVERSGIRRVCLAGGVALNSLANGRIERELGIPLYVHPAAGDAGGALGAALYYHHCVAGHPRMEPLVSVYLGKAYDRADCLDALRAAAIADYQCFDDERELLAAVAARIADGQVIGWFQGRFEWGPRALGARSILADPRRAAMQEVVNERIKFREPFRPFAPSVIADRADEYFHLPPGRGPLCPEDFMLSVSAVRRDKVHLVPAITHVDGTSRVQLVRRETNPRFAGLLEAFDAVAEVPMLLNTSFNRRGEPIVASPGDALETFLWTGLDAVVLGDLLVTKG